MIIPPVLVALCSLQSIFPTCFTTQPQTHLRRVLVLFPVIDEETEVQKAKWVKRERWEEQHPAERPSTLQVVFVKEQGLGLKNEPPVRDVLVNELGETGKNIQPQIRSPKLTDPNNVGTGVLII